MYYYLEHNKTLKHNLTKFTNHFLSLLLKYKQIQDDAIRTHLKKEKKGQC